LRSDRTDLLRGNIELAEDNPDGEFGTLKARSGDQVDPPSNCHRDALKTRYPLARAIRRTIRISAA
jgi:hypothetical protein